MITKITETIYPIGEGFLAGEGEYISVASGTRTNETTIPKDYPYPGPRNILAIAETYGVDLTAVIPSPNSEQLFSMSGEVPDLTTALKSLKRIGHEPVITISEEISDIEPRKTRTVIISTQLGKKANLAELGRAHFSFEEESDIIPQNISIQIAENQFGIDASTSALFFDINRCLRAIVSSELNPAFDIMLEDAIDDKVTLDEEKIAIISNIRTILTTTDQGYFLGGPDRTFLKTFEEKIIHGEYDEVFKNATKDTFVAFALTQIMATLSPTLGIGVGALTDPALGAAVASATYLGAPIPSWLYIMYKGWQRTGRIGDLRSVATSFIGINFPLIGSGAAFPISVNQQTNGDLARYKRIVRAHPSLSQAEAKRERILNTLLFGRTRIKAEQLTYDQIETDPNWQVLEIVSYNGNGSGLEVLTAATEEAKHQAAQFVAEQHIKHKLSFTTDENITNVGTEENPIYEVNDCDGCSGDWLVIRDRKTKRIVLANKIYRKDETSPTLPMQIGVNGRSLDNGINLEQIVSQFNWELGSLAFNMKGVETNGKGAETIYRYTLALLTWLRGLNLYMTQNGIDEFGAIFTRKAHQYISRLGELGLETISPEFYYMPSDETNEIGSEVVSLNIAHSRQKMLTHNPNIYDFVFDGRTNDPAVREAIWRSVITENFKANSKDTLLRRLGKILTSTYLKYRAGGLVAFEV